MSETKHSIKSVVKTCLTDGKKLPTVPHIYAIVFNNKVEFEKYSAMLLKDREEEQIENERIISQFDCYATDAALAASLSN